MEIISAIFNSSIIMYILSAICVYIAIRCFIYGVANNTSIALRVCVGILFLCLTAYCIYRGYNAPAKNIIDRVLFDAWYELKLFFGFVKTRL